MYFILKAVISGLLIAVASGLAKRYPGIGALMVGLYALMTWLGPRFGLQL